MTLVHGFSPLTPFVKAEPPYSCNWMAALLYPLFVVLFAVVQYRKNEHEDHYDDRKKFEITHNAHLLWYKEVKSQAPSFRLPAGSQRLRLYGIIRKDLCQTIHSDSKTKTLTGRIYAGQSRQV